VDDVHLDHQVLVDELGRIAVVGVDAADLGRSDINPTRLLGGKEGVDGPLVGQIQLSVGPGDDMLDAASQETA
jgi:hypothetical protein